MITVFQVLEATEGGTRRHVRDLVHALDPTVFCCVLVVSCHRDPAFRKDLAMAASRGIRVVEIPMRRGLAPLADVLSLFRLIACIRALRPDVIHAHSAKAGGLMRVGGFLCRVPVIYTPHAFPFLMQCGSFRQRLYRGIERLLLRATAALVAVSREECREADALGYSSAAIHYVPNGIERAAMVPVSVRQQGVLQIGFFGRLTRQKGADLLITAAADVVTHVPQVMFILHGVGSDEARLRQQVADLNLEKSVRFAGAYALDDAVARMRQMDLVVIPSRWEGFPYVALEAFQAGVPVVASAVGGLTDLVQDGVNGLLVQSGDSEALCDAMLRLLRDSQQREQMAEQARLKLAGYTIETMQTRLAELYHLVSGK